MIMAGNAPDPSAVGICTPYIFPSTEPAMSDEPGTTGEKARDRLSSRLCLKLKNERKRRGEYDYKTQIAIG